MSGYQHVSSSARAYFQELRKGNTYLEEAEFGLRCIIPYLDGLPRGARVLEVGSGPCIVLSELTSRYKGLHVEGIEPFGEGFHFFNDFMKLQGSGASSLNLHSGGYESFRGGGDWDLIFLINVFEHLPDWRDFLDFVLASLSDDGVCVILCPNYGFPYESHFRLPVVFNKTVTERIFRSNIKKFEDENDCKGLYSSLNFVSLSNVRAECEKRSLLLQVNTSTVDELISRLEEDSAFNERQGVLRWPALIAQKVGLLSLARKSKFIQNFIPYMHLNIRIGG